MVQFELPWDEGYLYEDLEPDALDRGGLATVEERLGAAEVLNLTDHEVSEVESKISRSEVVPQNLLYAYLKANPPTIGPKLLSVFTNQEARDIR